MRRGDGQYLAASPNNQDLRLVRQGRPGGILTAGTVQLQTIVCKSESGFSSPSFESGENFESMLKIERQDNSPDPDVIIGAIMFWVKDGNKTWGKVNAFVLSHRDGKIGFKVIGCVAIAPTTYIVVC